MDNDESCNDSIVETSDLDSNATVSPMLPGLYSLFERYKMTSPERDEEFSPVIPMIGNDILMDNLHALQDDTMSQESDVLINLDATKCRALSPGTSSVRVALSFDEDDMKERAAENTSNGSNATHVEGVLLGQSDSVTATVTGSPCRQNPNYANRKENDKGHDPVSRKGPQVERLESREGVGNVCQIKGDKKLTASNGGDVVVGQQLVTETAGDRVNIDEDISEDRKNGRHNDCHGNVGDATEKTVLLKEISDETNNCVKESHAIEDTQDVTTDDTVICCDSNPSEQCRGATKEKDHSDTHKKCDSDTPDKGGSDTPEKCNSDTPEKTGSDTYEKGDKYVTQDLTVENSLSSDTMDIGDNGGFGEQGKYIGRKEGVDSDGGEDTEAREGVETQGTHSPSLLEPSHRRDEPALVRAEPNKQRHDTGPEKPVEDRSRGRQPTPSHLPLSASPPRNSVDSTCHKHHTKAIKRHDQEMMVLNKVETQLASAEFTLKQGGDSVNDTVSKTLTVLRPLLGQLTRSQKQERDRIERELGTSGATKLKRVNKTELVGQTQLLHIRQRRLVMLVQQHRRLVDKIGSSVTRKDQPMKTLEDNWCGTSMMSFSTTAEKDSDGYSTFHKTPQMTDATQQGNTIASTRGIPPDGATIDPTTMAMKHKDPPGGNSSGMGKKQKTSSAFRAPYKDTVTVHDSDGDENTKTFPDGKTMTCELWGISEDSEMGCHGNLGRNNPRCFPMAQSQSSKMTQNRYTVVVGSNGNALPACTQTAGATTANIVSQPLLTSTSAATCRQMTASSISRPDGLSQQTLMPAAVISWTPQPGPSCNSTVICGKEAPRGAPNQGNFQPIPQSGASDHQHTTTVAMTPVHRHSRVQYPSVKTLMDIGLVRPGRNVFSIQTDDKTFHGSLLPNGCIEGAKGVIYKTPTGWFKSLLGNEVNPSSIKKKHAYQRILHDDKPLSRFRQVTKTTSDTRQDDHVTNKGEMKLGHAPALGKTTRGNLWALMGKRYVTLIDDAELFPSNSFLPSNFWDTPGFKGVDLPRELIDSIECW